MEEIDKRRFNTEKRFEELSQKLGAADGRAHGKACVYATGSFGRGDASSFSDLDLFIVGKRNGKENRAGVEGSLLRRLDEICIKADLINATRAMNIPEFDGDGRYLAHYSVHEFTKSLGKPEDDATNTFTARLLMLLESRPLLEQDVYEEIIEEVVAAYWIDFEDHSKDFVPAFLANDILRLWRTFCVNYEANTETQPPAKKAKRKVKNFKLKHSRLLTCYSALLYLLAKYQLQGTVTPNDALGMVLLNPVQRLEWLSRAGGLEGAHDGIENLLNIYNQFLLTTDASEDELIGRFLNKEESGNYMKSAYRFGDQMFEVISEIGKGSRFHRLLVV